MYQDWHVDEFTPKPFNGKIMSVQVKSPVDQDAIIYYEYQNKRQIPPGCKYSAQKVNVNLFVYQGDGSGWNPVKLA